MLKSMQNKKKPSVIRQKNTIDYERQMEALIELSKAMTSSNYLKDILLLGVSLLSKVVNTKLCSLMIVDEKKTGACHKSLAEQER